MDRVRLGVRRQGLCDASFLGRLAGLPGPARESVEKHFASRPVWAYLGTRRRGAGGEEADEAFAGLSQEERVILGEAEEAFGFVSEEVFALCEEDAWGRWGGSRGPRGVRRSA